MIKLARDAGNVLICRATWGGSQNYLGARWIERVVDKCPAHVRERVALRLVSLSPHYFFDSDIQGEAARNRQSRRILADELIAPYLTSQARVLDYGCGPGYLAAAVADKAAHVDAVDISCGVLACARVLNARPNITYQTPGQFSTGDAEIDVAYSFAVVQHLRTETLQEVLSLLADKVRPGGVLLVHFAVPDQLWRTENEWLADRSLAGRAKLRYGLNCFGRSVAEMAALVAYSGFTDVEIRPVSETLSMPGEDITDQHLLTARRE